LVGTAARSGGTAAVWDQERIKPAPRSPDTKAALAYLEASGANAISITAGTGGIVIAVGYKPDAIVIFWLRAEKARSVAATARNIAGPDPDVADLVQAIRSAAAEARVWC
jgi:hypothetical protein